MTPDWRVLFLFKWPLRYAGQVRAWSRSERSGESVRVSRLNGGRSSGRCNRCRYPVGQVVSHMCRYSLL